MSVIINKDLPYINKLIAEGIKVEVQNKDFNKKYIKIGLLNLMPNKEDTELQILKAIGKSEKDIWVDFMYTKTYNPKHVNQEYLEKFYSPFQSEKIDEYDGMIITGAPLEKMDFEEVLYWNELKGIMELTNKRLKSTLYICWAAQAALYHFYNIDKVISDKKIFGVFNHKIIKDSPLFLDLKEDFWAPHSRYSYVKSEKLLNSQSIEVLDESEIGPFIITSNDYKNVMFLGHIEYEKETLKNEYNRDINKGVTIEIPKNYFYKNNPSLDVMGQWDEAKEKLFKNWINIIHGKCKSMEVGYENH